ncbi:MAG: hypothetical protein JWQ09_4218, partial [Segetibacter sp.]|nr:hypothetical protein [Segetibacter sp.]
MKIKSLFVAALLACAAGLSAALPNPLMFNTAINTSYTGVVGLNNPGSNWEVALTNIAGPYYFAKQAFVTGWATSPDPLANWVTYPQHNCSGATNIAEHQCYTSPLTGVQGDVEEFYRIRFDLPATVCQTPVSIKGVYNLALKFLADNLVYQVYINGNVFWTN